MDFLIEFFRDKISGFTYVIYVLVILFFIFAIIGYLVTDRYNSSK